MNLQTAKVLREARALIADERCWLQGMSHWTDEDGRERFCSSGAIFRAGRNLAGAWLQARAVTVSALNALEMAAWTDNVPGWNDSKARLHEEVLAAFDAAIENEERRVIHE